MEKNLERLEELEGKTIKAIDTVGEIMKLIGLELKQNNKKDEIQDSLTFTVELIQSINDELHYIIDGLP